MRQNPMSVTDHMRFPACECFLRRAKGGIDIKVHGKPKLILELLRKCSGRQALGYHLDKFGALASAQGAMLKTTGHHCPRSPMPETAGLRNHECNTSIYRPLISHNQSICQSMQILLAQMREIAMWFGDGVHGFNVGFDRRPGGVCAERTAAPGRPCRTTCYTAY
jgi:hypothetical protein